MKIVIKNRVLNLFVINDDDNDDNDEMMADRSRDFSTTTTTNTKIPIFTLITGNYKLPLSLFFFLLSI